MTKVFILEQLFGWCRTGLCKSCTHNAIFLISRYHLGRSYDKRCPRVRATKKKLERENGEHDDKYIAISPLVQDRDDFCDIAVYSVVYNFYST